MTATLYVAAKAPRPGFAKTRLSRAIGDQAAIALYRAFLIDLATRFTRAQLPLAWYITPPDAWLELGPLLPPIARSAPVLAQGAGDWTLRQRQLFQLAAHDHVNRTLLIASDSPQLSVETIQHAFALLDTCDVVLGPVYDGGYYLIGMRGWHDILGGVTMSTGNVLDDLLARAAALHVSVGLLPATFDIDEAADLRHLIADVTRRDDMPATRAALSAWGLADQLNQQLLQPVIAEFTSVGGHP